MKTAEEYLIDACINAGFTEDYAKMIFRINPDSSNAFVEAMKEYTKDTLEEYTNRIVENAEAKTKCYPFGDMESYPVVDKESITSQLPLFLKEIGL
jgi:hypothetical protein